VFAERLGLSVEGVRKLPLRRVRAPRRQPSPAPPLPLAALLRELSPEAADLLALTSAPERVLYYDPELPHLR